VVRLLSVRDARTVLRTGLLPERQPDRVAPVGVRHLRVRVPRPSVRRGRIRSHRRRHRAEIRVHADDHDHGPCDR